ncbi:DUF2325 domain-containing protein [Herbaspirillum sp. NPDC087042]|uniref:DUF2325 domain-containing protein n=1 Tax=Herbaspirillum sp. NPDC087042 TaxID=3364004 RepID=UPI00380AC93B
MDHHTHNPPETTQAEYLALLRHLASVQQRCSAAIADQAREIAQLRSQTMQLRAQVIARDSALAWALADRAALEEAAPDLAPRATLTRKVRELHGKLQDLMREKMQPALVASAPPSQGTATEPGLSELEASVAAADLVICQTGCLSHGAYWRVQDQCKRTGKTCMLVEQPARFRVMRIHQVRQAVMLDADD